MKLLCYIIQRKSANYTTGDNKFSSIFFPCLKYFLLFFIFFFLCIIVITTALFAWLIMLHRRIGKCVRVEIFSCTHFCDLVLLFGLFIFIYFSFLFEFFFPLFLIFGNDASPFFLLYDWIMIELLYTFDCRYNIIMTKHFAEHVWLILKIYLNWTCYIRCVYDIFPSSRRLAVI